MNSEETAEQEAESKDASVQETESEDNITKTSGFPIITPLEGINGEIDSLISSDDIYFVSIDDKYYYVTLEGKKITNDEYEEAYPFNEGLACVCKNGKFGYLDKEGNCAIPFQYDSAGSFVEGLAYFSRGDDYGFIDKTGTPVFYLDCDSVSNFQEGLAYICVDGKYGYIDQKGEIVIQPVYYDAGYFQNGFAKVMRNGKYGVIDKTGQEVIEPKYQHIRWYGDSVIGFHDEIQGRCGYMYEGNIIEFKENYDFKTFIPERKLIITSRWEEEGWGIIDFEGNIKVPFEHNYIEYDEDSNLFIVGDRDNENKYGYGILSAEDFTWKVSCIYDYIRDFVNGKAVVEVDKKYGVIDVDGNIDMPISYDLIRLFENGGYWYIQGEISYLFDENKNLLVKGDYGSIRYEKNCYWVSKRDLHLEEYKAGFLDLNGEVILSPRYEIVTHFDYGEPGVELLSGPDNVVVKTEDKEREELPSALQYNKLTPRVPEYLEFLEHGKFFVQSALEDSGHEESVAELNRKIAKLYDLGEIGCPALYLYGRGDFGASSRGFFVIQGGEVVCLLSAIDRGAGGGERSIYLWYDCEKGRLLPGKSDFFHGSWGATTIYELIDGECAQKVSFGSTYSYTGPEMEGIATYYVNEEETTKERYEEVRRRYTEVGIIL